jgi:hypothetical protein
MVPESPCCMRLIRSRHILRSEKAWLGRRWPMKLERSYFANLDPPDTLGIEGSRPIRRD